MHPFIIILTDTCDINSAHYVFHTSINAFHYRTEVFKDTVLIDAIEINCTELEKQQEGEYLFLEKYKQTHKEMREKYCYISENKNSPLVVEATENKDNIDLIEKPINKSLVKMLIFITIGIFILFLLYQNFFRYSELYVDTFFSNQKEKIAYLKKIEPETHILENKCKLLSKNRLGKEDNITVENCTDWCNKGIISKNKCELFLAYFSLQKESVYMPAQQINKSSDNNASTKYIVFPEEETIEFTASKTFHIKVHNISSHEIFIQLKGITLDKSPYEEIVQFKDAITSFRLNENEEKVFSIFLESSYYKQFISRKYTGTIWFDVIYKNKKVNTIKKIFYFMVK